MYFPFLHFHPFNSVAHISSAASTSTIVIRTLDEGAQFIFRQSIIMKNRDRETNGAGELEKNAKHDSRDDKKLETPSHSHIEVIN